MNINLLSLNILIHNELFFDAVKKRLIVTNDDNNIIMKDTLINTLFKLRLSDAENIKIKNMTRYVTITIKRFHKKISVKFWYKTLDYLNYIDVVKLSAIIIEIKVVKLIKKEFYELYAFAKQHKTSSRELMSAVNDLFYRIHTDLLDGKDSLLLIIKGLIYVLTLTDQNT